ncbi:hypothetical protein ABL78_3799 [Leptomonas seymouri]|uniref:Palmitoyltransferase n=1 Tax=Leptomonas seymouri TaxID=5684 RepID=A0A0N0P628_LEPSE|nr:hypothetical protein ABL78_3799 [Leptomonas seymouri]|eukprot:KPI87146.1 hypothetical protein ABL78_3799 [Leptomonas seymouri]
MAIPNLHTKCHMRTRQELLHMVAAYLLPSLIFVSAVILAVEYNLFFFFLLRGASSLSCIEETRSGPLNDHGAKQLWLNCSATWGFSLVGLCVGDLFFLLMFSSFLRAVFTCAGYVSPEPWRWPPKANAERRRSLRAGWARQQEWLHNEEARARQKAQATELLQRQQQLLRAMQLRYLQECLHRSYCAMSLGGQAPSGPLGVSNVAPLPAGKPISSEPREVLLENSLTVQHPSLAMKEEAGKGHISSCECAADTLLAKQCVVSVVGAHDEELLTSSRNEPDGVSALANYLPLRRGQCVLGEPVNTGGDNAGGCVRQPAATPQRCLSLSSSGNSSFDTSTTCTSTITSTLVEDANPAAAPSKANYNVYMHSHNSAVAAPLNLRLSLTTSEDISMNPAAVHEYEADGSLRFCEICHQYKPDGSHHCRACQRCVLDMDHHCHFLNNCVGRHNYKFFFLCVFYASLCGVVNSGLFAYAYLGSTVCAEWGHKWLWVPAGMGAIGVCVTHLWVQHLLLLLRGMSTLERMAQLSSERFLTTFSDGQQRAPNSSGCLSDCWLVMHACGEVLLQGAQGVLFSLTSTCRRDNPSRKSLLQLPSRSSADAAWTQAERRARRIELLFGRPRHLWEYLLPVPPRGGSCAAHGKANYCVHEEAV